ncbi:hypothetical protein [Flavivirga algicola]|uniref:Tetratricopeptide repeat protein n=1 Tax=Flavivirga algicola TaxID=2729136 RepID=A0ABX1S2W1_9FLAO|nr:hypothetical protein [Flavivirga algicola]NMH88987.1 hypothetical protein [Flavivirga algicola]
MKSSIIVFCVCFLSVVKISLAQNNIECKTKLSFFHEYVKAKNFDRAYEPWEFVRDSCPEQSIAIYTDGEKILKHKIKNVNNGKQKEFIEVLLKLWEKRKDYFSSQTPKGVYSVKAFQLMYDYRKMLQKTNDELYHGFDSAFKLDKEAFTNPKSLYTYFSLLVELHVEGKKTLKEVFDKYDDINEKIETEVKNYSLKLNKLIEKENDSLILTHKEKQRKASYESYLKNYDLISNNLSKIIDEKADCLNLIPLYNKDFEVKKTDSVWLKRAVNRLYYKECARDPLYEKLVKAYDRVAPSAETKIYVVTVLIKNGKTKEVDKYLAQAYNLETDVFKKSRLAYKIGLILKKKRSYAQARSYFRRSLKLNPSNGKPHLAIAAMYAASANECGNDNFNKRAVYWLAAKEAKKASRIDPTLKRVTQQFVSRYFALAPSKEQIFICTCSGKEIKIPCWINKSITVPKIN